MNPIVLLFLILVIITCTNFLTHLVIFIFQLEPDKRYFYYGIMMFISFFTSARIVFLITDLYFAPLGEGNQNYVFFYFLGNLFADFASFSMIFVVERYTFKKFHYIPSFLILVCMGLIVVCFIIGELSSIIVFSIIIAFIGGGVPVIYLYVGIKSGGRTRIKAFIIAIGLIVFLVGVLFYSNFLQQEYPYLAIISPILTIIGILIVHYGFLIYSVQISESDEIHYSESTKSLIEKLGIDLTRPENLTDEDISFYRERKICLVCKGKALGFTFICMKCEALYCEKCARTLSDLENTCWFCNSPLDESKPVKITERKEEKVLVEGGIHKKGNI